jgi:hypothetical protein
MLDYEQYIDYTKEQHKLFYEGEKNMFSDFFNNLGDFYRFQLGMKVMGKLPGIVKVLWTGFSFVLSLVLWITAFESSQIPFDHYLGIGVRILTILYCIVVWGGIIALAVLKYMKGFSKPQLYYWVVMIFSLLIEVLNMGEFSVLAVLGGLLYGYLLTPLPIFMNVAADMLVTKLKNIKK